ncbi:MAG: hypothetical protein IT310_05355 [Anaerolineales bacterium]|nr:hypothetical protein [Anaerolineales bacterium]
MRRRIFTLILGLTLLAACAPQPAPVFTGIPTPTNSPAPAHAPELRFALIGHPTDVNVWRLFDESGASYVNYALRSQTYPRLYQLVPPNFEFQPLAAEGSPAPILQEGEAYTAVVKLRAALKWTDGQPFTAEDVAFTVNTALKYELGYDWSDAYPLNFLDHAEAQDARTVKFYFKQKPNVGVWQYGALQGPLVQKAFWEPRLQDSSALLPDQALEDKIASARVYLNSVQAQVDELTKQQRLFLSGIQGAREVSGELGKRSDELQYAQNNLDKLLEERAAKILAAQQALYALEDSAEPTLGVWTLAQQNETQWTSEANPDFPFGQPNYDRVTYTFFADDESANAAFVRGDVDVILNSTEGSQTDLLSPSRSARFLAFNPRNEILSDVSLRKALACVSGAFAPGLMPAGFAPSPAWQNAGLALPCAGLSADERIPAAVEMLKSAGYRWAQEPGVTQPGSGLQTPDGQAFPRLVLLSTSAEVDSARAQAAKYIEQQALHLGIPLSAQLTDAAGLRYAVYSSGKYDLAVLGWRLSEYPGYLCDWFGSGGPFENRNDQFQAGCAALNSETDLTAAQSYLFQIQAILMEELPFVPLYAETTAVKAQQVKYPFAWALGGLTALYGAPAEAIPAP